MAGTGARRTLLGDEQESPMFQHHDLTIAISEQRRSEQLADAGLRRVARPARTADPGEPASLERARRVWRLRVLRRTVAS
jgi:hypothetical protein